LQFLASVARIVSVIAFGFYGFIPAYISNSFHYMPSIFYTAGDVLLVSVWIDVYKSSISVKSTVNLERSKIIAYVVGVLFFIIFVILIVFGFTSAIDFSLALNILYIIGIISSATLLVILNAVIINNVSHSKVSVSATSKKLVKKGKFYYFNLILAIIALGISLFYVIIKGSWVRNENFATKTIILLGIIRLLEWISLVNGMFIVGKPLSQVVEYLKDPKSGYHGYSGSSRSTKKVQSVKRTV